MTNVAAGSDVGQRLAAVLDELGIERAHLAAGPEVAGLIDARPSAVASLTLVLPAGDMSAFQPYAERLLAIFGMPMMPPGRWAASELLRSWPGVTVHDLPADYAAMVWADVVRDHVDAVVQSIGRLAARCSDAPVIALPEREGVAAGVRYRVAGSGPPLVLFPIGFAPTQWDAAIPELNKTFTTIRLGGAHIGVVQMLEERATGTYLAGVRSLFDRLEIGPGQRVLEVGAGSGALVRDLARRPQAPAEIVAVDINEYLLTEARALALDEGLGSIIHFQYGSAEDLPFPDDSFDVAYSSTVFEECDVDRGIAELLRVVKPGGRAGVIIRSADLPHYWNIEVPQAIRSKIDVAIPTAGSSVAGCEDASLYTRFAAHFTEVRPNPFWRANAVDSTVGRVQAAGARAMLSPAEIEVLDRALAAARDSTTAFVSSPLHSVTGTKPLRA